MSRVVVVGGGAAGMMAAISAAECGNEVVLLEKNEKLGKKIYITGKGRCNLTNACEAEDFFEHVEKNKKFLYGAYYGFDSQALMQYFEDRGLRLKTERANRVFPASDHASDVTRVLENELRRLKVETRLNISATGIIIDDTGGTNTRSADCQKPRGEGLRVRGVQTTSGDVFCDSLILATGGLSYPSTGSTGDGHRFAEGLGIKITPLCPSLVPLQTKEDYIPKLQGLALKNVTLSAYDDHGKRVFSKMGEMLFTHFGISGPLGLSLSCRLTEALSDGKAFFASIDLKPSLSEEQLTERVIRDTKDGPKKKFSTVLLRYVPGKLAGVIAELLPFDCDKNMSELLRSDRMAFIDMLKAFPFTITATRGFDEAIITRGGISTKEINPSTMECKKISGLFFAGELIDIDARTGGFNLQIAWSTGRLAGLNA